MRRNLKLLGLVKSMGLVLLLFVCSLGPVSGQDTVNTPSQKPSKPMPLFYLDAKEIEGSFSSKVKPEEIAVIQVLPLYKAMELHGEKGKNGVTYVFSRDYCVTQYQKAFSSRSEEYKKVLKAEGGSDARIQYIVDGKVLTAKPEGRLFTIRNNPTYYLKIIEAEGLALYGVTDKLFGFVITKRVN